MLQAKQRTTVSQLFVVYYVEHQTVRILYRSCVQKCMIYAAMSSKATCHKVMLVTPAKLLEPLAVWLHEDLMRRIQTVDSKKKTSATPVFRALSK